MRIKQQGFWECDETSGTTDRIHTTEALPFGDRETLETEVSYRA